MKTATVKPVKKAALQNSGTGNNTGNTASNRATQRNGAGDNSNNPDTEAKGNLKDQAGKSKTNAAAAQKEQTPFEKLFLSILKDTYWAEKHIVESMPEMIDAATTEGLKEALEDHLHTTNKQVKRLVKVFKILGHEAEAIKCPVMEALVKEGRKCIEETPAGSMTRDAGIIISSQKIEHYEIAAYGSLVQVALTLGHNEAADLLEQTLMEEEDTDLQLTDIAESEVNPMADEEDEVEEGGKSERSDKPE